MASKWRKSAVYAKSSLFWQISALEKDLVGLKSPSAGDVAAVLDSYQEQVRDQRLVLFASQTDQTNTRSFSTRVF